MIEKSILVVLIVLLSSGCASNPRQNEAKDSLGSLQTVAQQLIAPLYLPKHEQIVQGPQKNIQVRLMVEENDDDTQQYNELSDSLKIKRLRMAFRNADQNMEIYGEPHRARIQDWLFAASNQRCDLYITYLKRISTSMNGIFDTLATVLGGAGAIVTGADAAQLLSGLAGITSGTRAAFNQAIFESVATSVLIPAIQNKRAELLNEILKTRSDKLAVYTIEGAIADAIRYHGACGLDAGIS